MFTAEEMQKIREMQAAGRSINAIAREIGIHRTTLERNLLKFHQIVIEPRSSCALVPLAEYTRQRELNAAARMPKPGTIVRRINADSTTDQYIAGEKPEAVAA